MCHDNEKLCKNWRGIELSVQNWHGEIRWILIQAIENLQNLHYNGLPLTKVYNVWAKTVQGSYVLWHWVLMQNLNENWLLLSKMTWEIWEIFTRALESLKIGTLMTSLYPKYKMYELKMGVIYIYLFIYRGVIYHDNEKRCKIE